MKAIVKLAVLFTILWAVFSYGRPWIEELLGARGLGRLGGAGNQSARCLVLAQDTMERFADIFERHGQQPIDHDRWSGAVKMTQGRLLRAQDACTCDEQGCVTAHQALTELDKLMMDTDAVLRLGRAATSMSFSYTRIERLMDKARAQAGVVP